MAVVVGEAAVRLRPETSTFAAEAEHEVDSKLPGIAGKAAGFFAAAFAAVGIGAFLGHAIEQASDLSESASKVGVVFGDSAGAVRDFAANASTAFGQSEAQALSATGTFGNLLRSVGLTEQASADMSTSMVGLASDLASFNNTDVDTALEALRSGLVGESEPLKQFGVNLNAAQIEAEAVRLGLIRQGEALTDAAKSQAVYSLILQQTTLAQGDFARTSGGWANQQRIIGAQFQELSANVGGLLVPVLGLAAQVVSGGLMPGLLRLTDTLPDLGNALGVLGPIMRAAFEGDDEALGKLAGNMTGLAGSLAWAATVAGDMGAIFAEVFADGQAGASLLAEGGLGALAAHAAIAARIIGDTLGAVWSTLVEVAGPALAQVSDALTAAFGGGGGGGGIGGIVSAIGPMLEPIAGLIAGYIGRWADVFAAIIPIIADVLTALAPVVSGLVAQIGPVLASLLPVVQQVAGVFATTLVAVLSALAPVIPPLVAAIGQVASVLAGALLAVITALAPVLPVLAEAIGQIATALAGALAGALQAVLPVLPVIAEVIAQVATALAGGLATALQAVIPILPPLVEALATIAQVLITALMGAITALLPIIPMLVDVLVMLVTSAVLPLLPILPMLANLLATIIAAVAPLIPVVIQVVALLIQLAIAAIMPLLPVIIIAANLFAMLVQGIVPVIQIVVAVVGAFIGMGAAVISTVVGLVSTVVRVFTGLIGGISSIFSSIFSVIRGVWSSITSWVSGAVGKVAGAISGAFSGVVGAIGGMFSGIGSIVSGAFSGAVGAVKGALNGVIGVINSGIGFINRNLIDNANKVPFISIPHIPNIPRLHSGGVFTVDDGTGEGLALLRDRERVATPEQREVADRLLAQLLDGTLTGPPAPAAPAAGGVTVAVDVHPTPGMDERLLAAHVASDLGWQLATGATRPVDLLGAST